MKLKINATGILMAVIMVPVGGNFQAALNAAKPGDEVVLPANGTYVGGFVLPKKDGEGVITIRSEGGMAKVLSPGQNIPALRTAAGASHYVIRNIEFGKSEPKVKVTNLILLGDGSETSLEKLPSDITLDHIYAHGDPESDLRRCIALNGADLRVTNSQITECHERGADSQAIAGWNGPGPFVIENNLLEAASENILFGGADPKIPNLVPSDITIRGNTIRKPEEWKGKGFEVKNLFETKNARHVLVENNTFENVWTEGQTGTAILIKSANQNGKCPWCVSEDITFRNNTIRNAEEGVRINAAEGSPLPQKANDIHFEGDKFENISRKLFQIFGGVNNVSFNKVEGSARKGILFAESAPSEGLSITNSVFERADYGIGSGAEEGSSYLAKWFPGATFQGNTILNSSKVSNTALSQRYGSGTKVVTSVSGVILPREVQNLPPSTPASNTSSNSSTDSTNTTSTLSDSTSGEEFVDDSQELPDSPDSPTLATPPTAPVSPEVVQAEVQTPPLSTPVPTPPVSVSPQTSSNPEVQHLMDWVLMRYLQNGGH